MSKLLNLSLKKLMIYAGLVLVCSMPVYYIAISKLWQYELDEHDIVLTPEASREDTLLIVGAITLITILFFMLLVGGLILLNRRISKKLWQPFYKSLHQIIQFDLQQNKSVVFEQTEIDEFKALNKSLDKLIAGSIAAYNQQKEFADNASHELQTPLAVVQSKLDLLLQSKSLTSEQYDIIEEALKAVSRVNRINKNLLLLTKIENSQFMDKEVIDLSELLHHTIRLFDHFSEDKQIKIIADIHPNIEVDGNKILVEILFNNLITNAIRHSVAGSTISMALEKNYLVITNAGTAPLNADQLFRRFASSSSQSQGTGLGLALVMQICNRYNWHVKYSFENGQHVFSLHF